jgi:hypothetical protein
LAENRPASKTAMERRKPESPCILRCLTPDPPPLLPRVLQELPVDDASLYAVFRPDASDTLSPWHVLPPALGRRTLGSMPCRCCASSWACRHRCRRIGGLLLAAHRGEVSITVCEGESEGEGLVNGRDAAVCVQMTRCREDFSRGVSFSLGCAQCSNLSLLLSNAAAAINLPRK